MTAPLLPFTLARDQQVLVEGARLLIGPGATALGLRRARRASDLHVEPHDRTRGGVGGILAHQ
ncbi:MAG: hypothetical protein ACNA7M_07710 [Roseovarius sp.]